MEWRRFFSEEILDRGFDYYCDDAVRDLYMVNGVLSATVEGTYDYIVKITFGGEQIIGMFCSCPYAQDGNYCKHMAAVLYEHDRLDKLHTMDEINKTSTANKPTDKSAQIKEVVFNLDKEILQKELLSILENDQNLCAKFMLKHNKNDENISQFIKNKRKIADDILRQYSDRHGFVDWRNASSFASHLVTDVILELRDFASDEAGALAAFDASLYVCRLYADTDIDDSGGETQYIIDECIALWDTIVEKSTSRNFLEYVLDELMQICEDIGYGEYIVDEIEDFISMRFNDNDFALTRLISIDNRIQLLQNDANRGSEYELTNCVKERIKLMEELGHSRDDVEEFRKLYFHIPAIREMVMTELENAGNFSELIQLLEQSKETDIEHIGLVSKYSRKLIDCYFMLGYHEKAKEELFTYITKYRRGNIDAFIELKKNTTANLWHQKRNDIFEALSANKIDIKHLLAEEGLKNELFDLLADRVQKGRGYEKLIINEISKYERALMPDYENELLDWYEELIWKMSEFAGGRSYYKEIIVFMRRMLFYAEGKSRVKKILELWPITYSNRPAMLDELQVLSREL
ncbi:MAG: SWIM zinc finger family protein [Oscillospiraceae bacterium]|nr:SWIM zinc finger family protein [Oscillospiraceae bacterium]